MTIVAWAEDNQCLDERCNARAGVGQSWDGRALYCSLDCFLADGHTYTAYSADDPDAHTACITPREAA